VDAKFVTPYLPTVLSLKGKIDVATLSFLQRKTELTYMRALQTRLTYSSSTLRNLPPRPLGRLTTRCLRFGSGSTSEIDCGPERGRGLTSVRLRSPASATRTPGPTSRLPISTRLSISERQRLVAARRATHPTMYREIVDLFTDLAPCFNTSRPNFLVLTVPPISRAPLFVAQGSEVSKQVADATKVFNDGLKETVMPSLSSLGGYAGLFDTAPVFNVGRKKSAIRSAL
jgi:hypothetical protein